MIIYTDIDLKKAIQRKESTIHIKDEKIGNSFLLANKIQDGLSTYNNIKATGRK